MRIHVGIGRSDLGINGGNGGGVHCTELFGVALIDGGMAATMTMTMTMITIMFPTLTSFHCPDGY